MIEFLISKYKELLGDYAKRLKAQPGVVIPGLDRAEDGGTNRPSRNDANRPEAFQKKKSKTAAATAPATTAAATAVALANEQKAQKMKSSSKNQTSNKEKSIQKPHTGVKTAVTQAAPFLLLPQGPWKTTPKPYWFPTAPRAIKTRFTMTPTRTFRIIPDREITTAANRSAFDRTNATSFHPARPISKRVSGTAYNDTRSTAHVQPGLRFWRSLFPSPWQPMATTCQHPNTSGDVSPFGFTGLADVPQSSLFTYGSMSQRRVDVQAPPIYRQSQRIPMSQNSTSRNVEAELRDEIAILREENASLREETASLREAMAGMVERQAAAAGDIAALWRELRPRRCWRYFH
ncbi:hypothetical protein TrVFT333_009322 [Trichoderma virens FT-333]|nr:hypothetical protein TrVFT333_009322 [Trichoderma virens FT-333]